MTHDRKSGLKKKKNSQLSHIKIIHVRFFIRIAVLNGINKIPLNFNSTRFMEWKPVLFRLGEILNARQKTCDAHWALGQAPPQHRQTLSQAGPPGGQVFCQWYGSVAPGVRRNCFFGGVFLSSHLQNWNRKCWISEDQVAAGWQRLNGRTKCSTETRKHVGFAFHNWGPRFLFWFAVELSAYDFLHACK